MFERPHVASALFLLPAMLIRPDNILWLLPVTGFLWLRGDHRRLMASVVLAAFLLYAGLVVWSGGYGWRTLFYHSFIDRTHYPASGIPPHSMLEYIHVHLGAGHPRNLAPFLLFTVVGLWILSARNRLYGWMEHEAGAILVAGIFTALHWAVFPDDQDRFLVPAYIVVLIVLLRTLVGRELGPLANSPSRPSAPGSAHTADRRQGVSL